MTDNSVLIGNAQALTSDVRYTMKPSSVRCRSYQCRVPSSNKATFAPTETIQAFIPCRRNCFLDVKSSYMRYTLKNNNTTANNGLYLDGCAAGVVQRLDVTHSGNQLEQIQDYGILMAYLLDMQTTASARAGLEASFGCTSDRAGVYLGVGVQKTFCMPILSGVVGCLNEKMLPLSLADDIKLEFTLNTLAKSVVQEGTDDDIDWTLKGFELVLNVLELSDEGMKMVEQVSPFTEPIYMHGSSFRHYSSTLATGTTGEQSILVPARFASLKSLICLPRRQTEVGNTQGYSLSSRVNPNMETFWWRVGSLQVPQKPLQLKNTSTTGGYSEAYIENLRAWNCISSPEFTSSLTFAQFNKANSLDATVGVTEGSTGADSYGNGFAIATELENISNRSDTILSGTNCLNSQIFANWTCNTATSAIYQISFFANYDHIITLDPFGQLSIRY